MTAKIIFSITNYAKKMRNFLLDILFPIECLSCSKEGFWLCAKCEKEINIKTTQECFSCGKNNLLGEFCKKCKDSYRLDGLLIASSYNNKLLSKLIKTYKYKLVKDLSVPLSSLLVKLLIQIRENPENNFFWHDSSKSFLKKFTNSLVIPVPLHKKRLRWRGFNQSEELAKYFANYFNLKIDNKSLKRIKFIKPQTSLDRNKRAWNVENSFSWDGGDINKKTIILIDDVSTSTATLNECAKILKQYGARKVWGLVIAHG